MKICSPIQFVAIYIRNKVLPLALLTNRSLAELTVHMIQTEHYTNLVRNDGTSLPEPGAGTLRRRTDRLDATSPSSSSEISGSGDVLSCRFCSSEFTDAETLGAHIVATGHYRRSDDGSDNSRSERQAPTPAATTEESEVVCKQERVTESDVSSRESFVVPAADRLVTTSSGGSAASSPADNQASALGVQSHSRFGNDLPSSDVRDAQKMLPPLRQSPPVPNVQRRINEKSGRRLKTTANHFVNSVHHNQKQGQGLREDEFEMPVLEPVNGNLRRSAYAYQKDGEHRTRTFTPGNDTDDMTSDVTGDTTSSDTLNSSDAVKSAHAEDERGSSSALKAMQSFISRSFFNGASSSAMNNSNTIIDSKSDLRSVEGKRGSFTNNLVQSSLWSPANLISNDSWSDATKQKIKLDGFKGQKRLQFHRATNLLRTGAQKDNSAEYVTAKPENYGVSLGENIAPNTSDATKQPIGSHIRNSSNYEQGNKSTNNCANKLPTLSSSTSRSAKNDSEYNFSPSKTKEVPTSKTGSSLDFLQGFVYGRPLVGGHKDNVTRLNLSESIGDATNLLSGSRSSQTMGISSSKSLNLATQQNSFQNVLTAVNPVVTLTSRCSSVTDTVTTMAPGRHDATVSTPRLTSGVTTPHCNAATPEPTLSPAADPLDAECTSEVVPRSHTCRACRRGFASKGSYRYHRSRCHAFQSVVTGSEGSSTGVVQQQESQIKEISLYTTRTQHPPALTPTNHLTKFSKYYQLASELSSKTT